MVDPKIADPTIVDPAIADRTIANPKFADHTIATRTAGGGRGPDPYRGRRRRSVAAPRRRLTVRLDDFDYELPDRCIAQVPIEPRDAARLLVDRGERIEHLRVADLPDLLREGDLLVVNETRVIPARIRLQRATGGAAEVLLLEPLDDARRRWEALARPGAKLRVGDVLTQDGVELVRMGQRTAAGDTFEVEIIAEGEPLAVLDRHGEMPLPPYIGTRLDDPDRYQTVFANEPGSAAAPTAGLHLTPGVFDRLDARGVRTARVELVVGLDTFQPISTEDPLDHPMHTERYRVPESTWAACRTTREAGGRVVAVGTTAVRALESAAVGDELEGRTDIFIHRDASGGGFDWQVVDMMMTNFHLPKTTLLMMIDAFIGPRWRDLYVEALAADYRFLSFGDAMLLTRNG